MGFIKFLIAIFGGAIVALSIAIPIVQLTPDNDAGPYAPAALIGAFITIVAAMRGAGLRGAISNIFGCLFWSFALQVGAAYAIGLMTKPPIHVWIVRQYIDGGGWRWFAFATVCALVLSAVFRPSGAAATRTHTLATPEKKSRRRDRRQTAPPPQPAHQPPPHGFSPPVSVAAGNPVISGRSHVDLIKRG